MPPLVRLSTTASSDETFVRLDGGEPHPASFVALWRAGRLTDTVVHVEGEAFPASRNVLAAGSAFFDGIIGSGMRDEHEPEVREMAASAFRPCLGFIYEGSCAVEEGLLEPVLWAAHFLGIEPLEAAAAAAITARLVPAGALGAWALAEQLTTVPRLAEAARELILEHFAELGDAVVGEATVEQLEALLADNRLEVESEEAVFELVAHFAETRQPEEAVLLRLLKHVRFTLMPRAFLQGTVFPWPPLKAVGGLELLRDAFAPLVDGSCCLKLTGGRHLLLDALVPPVLDGSGFPRAGVGPRALYAVGGVTDGQCRATVQVFTGASNTWSAAAPMGTARQCCGAALLGGKLYVVGGEGQDGADLATVEAFDPQAGTWAAVAPMSVARITVAVAAVGAKLYAIGGFDGSDMVQSAEAFDPQTGAWAAVAPMATARFAPKAAVLDGKIYVAGGVDGGGFLNSMEIYDPATNTWAAAAPMATSRYGFGMAALGGNIYASGGRNTGGGSLSSVEAYDPHLNMWSTIAPMGTARRHFGLAAMRGKLFAVGGSDEQGATIATAEAYDPQHDSWEAVAPMAAARHGHALVAI